MTELKLTPHLTIPEGYDQHRQHMRSHKGMAHFAGTGPQNKTCRECASWAFSGRFGGNGPSPSPCRKFKALTGKFGAEVPHTAHVCKYFEQSPKPPRLRMYDFRGEDR